MDEFDKMFGSNNDELDEFAKMFGTTSSSVTIQEPERTVGSTLKDVGVSLGKGTIGAGQGLVGLADIPTGGRIGKGLESVGVKPDEWQKYLSGYYSPAQQAANQQVDNATGFVDTAKAMIQNPSTIAHGIVETLPSVAAGGVIGRGALAVGSRLAPKVVSALGKTGSAIAAGAVGEGTIGAGQTAEQIRNATADDLLTGKQAGLAAAAGLGTAIFGVVGGSLAKKLGFADVDTMIVAGLNPAKKEGLKGVVKSILGGGITEGVFEELPQTVQETIFTNAALDKPLLEGVPESSAQAIILGGAMGGGANLLPGRDVGPVKTEDELELDRRAGNILKQKDDEVAKSIQKLNEDLKSGQELLTDPTKLDQKARELNVDQAEVIKKTLYDNKINQNLLDRINAEIKKKELAKEEQAKKEYEALSPEDKAVKDIENKLFAKRQESAIAINDQINTIDDKIAVITKRYNQRSLDNPVTPEEQQKLSNDYIQLNQEKNKLLDRYKEEVVQNNFAPYTTREERQKIYEDLFGTYSRTVPSDKDAKESFQVFEANDLLPVEMANYANGLMQLKAEQQALASEKQALKPIEENNLKQIEDYVNYIRKVGERFTPPEQAIIENYWQRIKNIIELQQEEMTPGTEAFMRKKFFETQLDKIENNIKQDAATQVEPNKNVVPTLAEQNKHQQMFQKIAAELGDIPTTNSQAVTPEVPRDLPGGLQSAFNNEQPVGTVPQFQVGETQNYISNVTLAGIQKVFPGQTITKSEDGTISVQFKNGKGLTINSIQRADKGFIEMAIETGQMSKGQSIFGITVGNKILLDDNFADNKTLWHENKHVLDNLGLITEADNNALNKEFNKLRKAGKLKFALNTHEDPRQAMVENRANMFAQIMTDREAYRNTAFGKVIQRVMDFFQQLLAFGKQTVSGLAREVESGKIYERQVAGQSIKTTIPQYEEVASKWHSALENAVAGFQQKIGTPDQWKGMIKGYPGIKQEELDWIGLDEWLDSKNGKVSKDELVKFIAENNVRLEEVVKGYVPSTVMYEALDKIDAALEPYEYSSKIYGGKLTFTSPEGFDVNEDNIDKANIDQEVKDIFQYAKSILPEQLEDSRYEKYQLSGGKNYKELLITLPQKRTNDELPQGYKVGQNNTTGNWYVEDPHRDQFVFGLPTREEAIRRTWELLGTSGQGKAPEDSGIIYRSGHWDEPNILTHIRFNERTDVDGNRVLFLEEVQSDWHQDGRKQGYKENLTSKRKEELEQKHHDLQIKSYSMPDGEEYNQNYNERLRIQNILDGSNETPDTPFKKSWPLLAMKRMIRYAAENGFDKIAWTTGQQQADRYDLSKHLSSISYEKNNDGTYDFAAADKNDNEILSKVDADLTWIEENVGREIAQKIQNDEGSPVARYESTKMLTGLDLKVGGEGMKGFYDQMLPSMLNKEFNRGKWGNARVEQVDIGLQKDGKVTIKEAIKAFEEGKQVFVGDHLAQSRNEIETYPYDDLTMPMPDQMLSLPITNRMKSKALREGMPMFEVREATEQKISDDTYNQMFTERNSLVRTIGQTLRMRGHEIKQLIDKGLGSISTRLKNVDPMLRSEIRNLDFRTAQKIVTALRIAHPLLEKTKKMSPEDKFVWDAARRNSDEVKIKQIAEKYGMVADQEKLRGVLNQIRQDALDVGYDVGFIEEYWPRIIKDQEGFLQATKGISQRPVITDAIKKYADKLGMTVEKFEIEFPEQAADIASNTILGRNLGIGGPGNIQARQYDVVPPELNKFYMDSDAALMQYIYSMTKKIEARRFFGKVPERIANLKTEKKRKEVLLKETTNAVRREELSDDLLRIEQELDKYKLQRDYTENIGTYINDLRMSGRIQAEDEKVVRDILDARFHEHGTTGIINAYKNMSYIDVMGSPLSALTQIGDLAWAMYVGKVWTPRGLSNTIKNLGKAITKKSEITKEDLGIERIAQEFADGTTLGNAVSWVFKKVQLERIDSIGKETLINNAFDNYKAMASTEAGRTELLKQIKPIFDTQSESVINDLLAGNPTDNVKMLLYHRLLDFQPVALSEMPEQYLKSGNGRVFYMLKTYTIKQFDVFRNEAWHNIKSGEKDQVIEGIGNMIKLVSLLTLANAGADELKDLLLGKEVKFEDHVIENFLTMGGASKYVRMQTTREGLGSGLAGQILPPFRFVNSISKDLGQAYGDYVAGDTMNFDHARIVESIPIGGKLYYWNYGRGTDYKKSSNEQEFTKVGKEVKLFKRQLENVEDKRTFLNSNLDKFKQMKMHENFQASLNRNQAVINKLKDLEQTTNVRERLGQLQQQREMLLSKYFEVAAGMQ